MMLPVLCFLKMLLFVHNVFCAVFNGEFVGKGGQRALLLHFMMGKYQHFLSYLSFTLSGQIAYLYCYRAPSVLTYLWFECLTLRKRLPSTAYNQAWISYNTVDRRVRACNKPSVHLYLCMTTLRGTRSRNAGRIQ